MMSKTKPDYPISPSADESEREPAHSAPPPDLYSAPSFKFRHEVREPLENGETSYRRAYPHFYRLSPMTRRRRARRGE
jgi:hypothetical protein